MAESEDLLADLPAPNEAEPPSLRRDIADELLDHLECAARRESLKASDPTDVEHRVLSRFGNPRKIARQLWFDAMKEKLMMQKITLVLVSLVAVASLAACGLMFLLARDFQSASTELLSQSREVNAELLSQLSAIANREPEGPSLMEWVPLKVQVVKNDEAKTPGEGFKIRLHGPAISEAQSVSLIEETDEKGIADFGLVRPASYNAYIYPPWNETQMRGLVVKPGSAHVEKVLAPAGPPESYQVKPVVQWPKALEGTDVAVLVKLQRSDDTELGEHTWRPKDTDQYLLIRPDGRFATYSGISRDEVPRDNEIFRPPYVEYGFRFDSEPEVFNETFAWRGDVVTISGLEVLRLPGEAKFPGAGDFLVSLSYSPALEGSRSDHLKQFRLGPQSIERVPGDDPQEWKIQVDYYKTAIARSLLAIEEFPPAPNSAAMRYAYNFFGYDKDRNREISEEEARSWDANIRNRFKEFPVSFETYVKTSLEDLPAKLQKSS